MKIQALYDFVLLVPKKAEEKTEGLIVIPDYNKKWHTRCIVEGIGEGRISENGVRIKPIVKIGDEVLIPDMAGKEIKDGQNTFVLIREKEILAIIK